MSDLDRHAPARRTAVVVISAALVWWGGRGLAPAGLGYGRLGRLLGRLGGGRGVRGPLRRRSLDPAIRRGLALGGLPWLRRLVGGADSDRAPLIVAGVRLSMTIAGMLVAAAGTIWQVPAVTLPAAATAVGAGLVLDLRLSVAVHALQHRLADQLPLATELLGIALAAGQPLERALGTVAAEVGPPLRAVLGRTAARIATGAAAGDALREEAERTAVAGLARVAAAVERGMALGVPMGTPLHALAGELGAAQRSALLSRAGRATPLAALVTSLVIAPACVGALLACLVGAVALPGGVLG